MSTSQEPSAPRTGGGSATGDRELSRWGGIAGLGGGVTMIVTFAVVIALGLPDASDAETLTDFPDIEAGRIAEHFLYLGALMLFALHALTLHRLLREAHPAAALFGVATATFGFVILAGSSLLHVSTSPLSDLYTASEATSADRQAIEYAWHGAQSIFDTQLATGVLLVPIGIVLFGVAMRRAPGFGPGLTGATIGLGMVGVIGAVIAIIEPGSASAAASVLAFTAFHFAAGWRTWKLGSEGGGSA